MTQEDSCTYEHETVGTANTRPVQVQDIAVPSMEGRVAHTVSPLSLERLEILVYWEKNIIFLQDCIPSKWNMIQWKTTHSGVFWIA